MFQMVKGHLRKLRETLFLFMHIKFRHKSELLS